MGACFTRAQWANDLLTTLSVPHTPDNVEALVSWSIAEGGHYQNAARFNPLNTARKTAHSFVAIGLDGIRGYDSYQDGVDAIAETLHLTTANGRPTGYPAIVAALQNGHDVQAVLSAAGQSSWAGSHYLHTDWVSLRARARTEIASAKC